MPDRLTDWQAVLEHARRRTAIADGGLRIELDDRVALDDLARLVAAEQGCCAFFSIAITIDARGVALEVRAPEEAESIVTTLFGAAA